MSNEYWEEECNTLAIQLSDLQEEYDKLETQLEKSRAGEAELLNFVTDVYKNYECGRSVDDKANELLKKYGE